jgi:flagellar protein FlaG
MSIQAISTTLPQSSPEMSAVAREARDVAPVQKKAQAASSAAVSQEALKEAIKSIQEYIQPFNSDLEFSVNDDTRQVVVKVVDSATKEVIRQIPSEEMLAIAKALDSIKGLFLKQQA